jgi:thiazole synthase ThiGH ThiG subunit
MLLYHISSILIFIYYTSGARNAKKLFCATGKRSLETNWLKLEIHRSKYLMPDAIETLKAEALLN